MNTLYLIILLVVVFVIYVWYKRRQHYKGLTPYEKLWENFIRAKNDETTKKQLISYACKMLRTATTYEHLLRLSNEFSHYYRNRPFAFFDKEMEHLWTDEMRECFAWIRTELIEKNERDLQRKEGELLKAAALATTWEGAKAILAESCEGAASASLAIKKMNRFSLFEVLGAKTLEELRVAKERAREDSLARKYVPFMHEKIAKSMVEHADTIDDLIAAAELAPTEALACNTALYISFLKIDARRHQDSMNN